MFANAIIVIGLVGIAGTLINHLLTDEQKKALLEWDKRVQLRLETVLSKPFTSFARSRPVLWIAICAPLLLIVRALSGTEVQRGQDLVLVCIGLIGSLMIWWIGSARTNRAFLLRFIPCVTLGYGLGELVSMWLLSGIDEPGDAVILVPVASIIRSTIFVGLGCFLLLAIAPLLLAAVSKLGLKGMYWFMFFCNRQRKPLILVVCAVSAAVATGYKLITL